MQDKPNLRKSQMNVTSYMKSKYEELDTWLSGKNKPNQTPNELNTNPIKPNGGGGIRTPLATVFPFKIGSKH
jgi:hypothetical protein